MTVTHRRAETGSLVPRPSGKDGDWNEEQGGDRRGRGPEGRSPCRWCKTPGRSVGWRRAPRRVGIEPSSQSLTDPSLGLKDRWDSAAVWCSFRRIPPRLKRRPVSFWVSLVCLQWRTDNREELVGAAVREVTAHGVPSGEGGQTLLAIVMGLEVGRKQKRAQMGPTVPDLVKELVSRPVRTSVKRSLQRRAGESAGDVSKAHQRANHSKWNSKLWPGKHGRARITDPKQR